MLSGAWTMWEATGSLCVRIIATKRFSNGVEHTCECASPHTASQRRALEQAPIHHRHYASQRSAAPLCAVVANQGHGAACIQIAFQVNKMPSAHRDEPHVQRQPSSCAGQQQAVRSYLPHARPGNNCPLEPFSHRVLRNSRRGCDRRRREPSGHAGQRLSQALPF